MSAPLDAAPRRDPLADVRRLGSLALLSLLLVLLAVEVASADRPAATLHISAANAATSGSLVGIRRNAVGASSLVEVDAPRPDLLLAVSADGTAAALADQVGQLSGMLTLARSDGSQLRVPLPGLLSAGFSPDGSLLAVVDGRGALWRVDAESGDASQIAEGPFMGSPIFAADRSLLLLAVSSVEAPFRARTVRVDPTTGAVMPVTADDLDYAVYPLADGSVAVVSHEAEGAAVRRVASGASQRIALLEAGAVNAVVAADGTHVAYELYGRGVFLLDRPGAGAIRITTGSRPCFSADASALLVRRPLGSAVVALDGSVLATTNGQAGLAGAVGCLP